MDNSYDENTTGLGLDGVVNQPNPGFGLGVPTNEELDQYNNQRAMAPDIDGPVQYAHEVETSKMDMAKKLLGGLKTSKERQAYEAEQQMLDAQRAQVQAETVLRNETAAQADREKIQMQYTVHPKQQAKIEERQLTPSLIEALKKAGKAAVVAAAVIGVSAGIVAGAHSVLTKPEFVPEQTPQSIELNNQINNSENINEVIDAINNNKQQNFESVQTVIEDHNQKVDEAKEEREQKEEQMQELREETIENSSMSDSMQNFVNEVNRQKVISIESGVTVNPEQVVDSNSEAVGGRGL